MLIAFFHTYIYYVIGGVFVLLALGALADAFGSYRD